MHTVILGGTHQENDYNTNVDVDDRKFIREGCYRLMPSMRQAEIANEMVGLRPGRSEVRLKYDTFTTSKQLKWIVAFPNLHAERKRDRQIVHMFTYHVPFQPLQKVVNYCISFTITGTVELVLPYHTVVQLMWPILSAKL